MGKLRIFLEDHFPFIFGAPALLVQFYFLCIPLLGLFIYSLLSFTPTGSQFTLSKYRALLDPLYLSVMGNSCVLATATAIICLLIGFPIAYFLALKAGRLKTPLLVFLILPSWTSFIVQVYAWFFILEQHGPISTISHLLGFTGLPPHLLNSPFATLIGMVYCFLPFMVLPLFAVLERLDTQLLEASADLGANRRETFWRIIVPLSKPGIAAGLLLVSIPAYGEFVIPELLGGFKRVYVGTVIVHKFLVYSDWQSGAASVFMLLLGPLALLVLLVALLSGIRQWMRPPKSVTPSDEPPPVKEQHG